jgi:hypothetical protein
MFDAFSMRAHFDGVFVLLCLAFCACGGGSTVLFPARTADRSRVELGASGQFAFRPSQSQAAAPGVAPHARFAQGLTDTTEMLFAYDANAVSIGVRQNVWFERTENAGASTFFGSLQPRWLLPTPSSYGVQRDYGYGLFAPFGYVWSSDAGLVSAGVSAGVGAEHAVSSNSATNRFWYTAIVGIGFGFRHVHAMIEGGFEQSFIAASSPTSAVTAFAIMADF